MDRKIAIKPKRLFWADVIRVIAIFLVIQIHTSSFLAGYSAFNSLLKNFLSISVPLFVMLSGSLLLGKAESYGIFFHKRIFKLLFIWLIWTLIYMIYNFYFHNEMISKEFFENGYAGISHWVKFYLQYFLSVLWFIPMIFGIYLITPFFRRLVNNFNKTDNLYFLILWFMGFSVLPYIFNNPVFPVWNPSFVMAPIQFSGYFILGYLIYKKKLFANLSLRLVSLGIALPILISMISINNYYVSNLTTGFLSPGTVISALMLFILIYRVLEKKDIYINNKLRIVMRVSAQSVFGVYLIHGILLDLSYSYLFDFFKQTNTLVFSGIIFFLLCFGLVIIMKKIPLVKYLLP